jgi:hypothetical protein
MYHIENIYVKGPEVVKLHLMYFQLGEYLPT